MTYTSMEVAAAGATKEDATKGLLRQIHEIGLARFVGRINAGMIDATEGYRAVEAFSFEEQRRPLVSVLAHLLVGKHDPILSDAGTDHS